ncbi:DUF5683 domain-containing protein [Flectobacillus roseus]
MKHIQKVWLLSIIAMLLSYCSPAQILKADTIQIPKDDLTKVAKSLDSGKKQYKIIPRIATIRSAMVPGWGQIYNRQYWKLPILAAGFGVNVYFIIHNNEYYQLFLNKSRYVTENKLTGTSITYNGVTREMTAAQLKTGTKYYHRYRDTAILFVLVIWAANIVDANVTAHLKTFDLTDDISMKIQPSVTTPFMNSPAFGAKITLALK